MCYTFVLLFRDDFVVALNLIVPTLLRSDELMNTIKTDLSTLNPQSQKYKFEPTIPANQRKTISLSQKFNVVR